MYTSVKCHGGTLTHTYLTARFITFWSPSVVGEIDEAHVWGKVWKAVYKICISPYKAMLKKWQDPQGPWNFWPRPSHSDTVNCLFWRRVLKTSVWQSNRCLGPRWTCNSLTAQTCPLTNTASTSTSHYLENFPKNTHYPSDVWSREEWRRLGIWRVQAGVITWFMGEDHLFFSSDHPSKRSTKKKYI